MKYVYLILSIITSIYLVLSAKRDLKERLIYSFPCIVLMNAWTILWWRTSAYSQGFLIIYALAHVLIFFMMKHFKLWGDGDGDMFMLLGDICLACLGNLSPINLVIAECLSLAFILAVAIGIGAIEYKVENKPFKVTGDVAVVPGFAVVLIVIMVYGLVRRFM